MTFHEQVLTIATGRDWLSLGINLILSTIVGGIIIAILLAIFSKAWKEQVKYQNAFLMVLLINLVNLFGVLAFISPSVPAAGLVIPLLVWIGLTKAFFSDLSWKHALVTGAVGYVVSIFLIPNLVGLASGYLPRFPAA